MRPLRPLGIVTHSVESKSTPSTSSFHIASSLRRLPDAGNPAALIILLGLEQLVEAIKCDSTGQRLRRQLHLASLDKD